ncbi:MAG: PAS domain S-box protein, partial [Candidatus Thermoplasmatota archaeon]|nr:PAS domain S-box protein [Candidatus Thermoplasmatota archaeon]
MNGSINVLHVDDEPPLLDQAKVFLEKEDEKLDVTTVQTPKKALELLEKQDFDVIVSDYQMPDMDGLEFLEKVREERESDIPFIIFTGKGREEVAMKALNLGADQYLQKGGDPKAQFGVLAQVISQEVRHRKAEVALRESEEKYRNLFYEAPVGILHYNDEGVITDCNEVFVEFMGSSKETLLGFNMIEEMENEEVVEAVISSLEEGEGFYEGWYTSVTSSKKKYGSVKFKGLTDEGGDVRSGIGIVEDLSKQKETEDQIKNLNYMLRTIRNINQTIVKEDSLEDVMEKACKILVDNGYILGCSIASMDRNMIRPSIGEGNQLISDEWSLTPEGEGEAPECMKKTVRSQELQMKDTVDCGKCEYKKDEGSRKCVFIPMNSKDKVVGILTVEMSSLQDVTEEQKDLLQEVANDLGLAWEKIRLQKDLEESEEKFRNLAQTTSIAIMVYQDDQWVYANPAAEEISGYSAEEMKDMKFWEFVAPEHVEKVKERGKKRQSDIEALSGYEFKIITKQGEEKWVYLEGASFEYEGESAGLISVMDITEMKKKERMIKKLYEASIELENCTSEKEVYEQVLKSVEDILDFRACTILIEDENDLMVKATKAKNVEEGEKYSKDEGLRGLLFQQKKSYLIEDVSELEEAKTSHPSYKSALSIPIEDEGVFQALSEQKEYFDESDLNLAETLIYYMVQRLKRIRSKDELKRSKERFETLILNAQEGIYIRDLDGTITYVNEKFAEIHGYEKDELIGMKSWELLHPDCRDDTEPKKEYNEKLLEEDKLEERKIKRKDGEVRRVLITNEVTEDYEGNKEIFGLVRDIT